ncbi:unnamed protein product, partial [Phaeothamnion confervicola]
LPTFNFSFACGGWLQYYLFGVARCIQDHGLHRVAFSGPRKQIFAGCSAGALTAAALALDGDLSIAVEASKSKMIPLCRGSWMGPFRVTDYLTVMIPKCCNLDLARSLDQRLELCVTRMPGFRGERVTRFDDGDHLLKALLSSAAAIPLARPVKMKGHWYIDGGFTEFFPRLNADKNETIYVSPLYFSDAEIRPSRYVPLWWMLLPPSCPNTIDWLYDLGYKDCLTWLARRGLIDLCCDHRHQPARPGAAGAGTGAAADRAGTGANDPAATGAETGATADGGAAGGTSDATGAAASARNATDGGTGAASSRNSGNSGGGGGSRMVSGAARNDVDGGSGLVTACSDDVVACGRRPPRALHPYDMRASETSPFQRLVGYGAGNKALDTLLLWGVPLLVKPLVLALMFLEILIGVNLTVLRAAAKEAFPSLPYLL